MDSMYEIDIFDPIKNRLELYQKSFVLSPELWRKFKIDDISSVDFTKWGCIKLINGGAFSPELSKLPDKHGGIYIYCIEPRIVPDVGIYVMYIGKAAKQSLRTRVKNYKACLNDPETRPRLHNLFTQWGDYIYVHYLPVEGSEDAITVLEDRLIAAYGKPPCNAEVRCKSVKLARRAFDD